MSKRIQQVNQLIKKELSKIILKEIEFPSDVLVTITRVESSPNLIQAKVYVSVVPESRTLEVFQFLNRKIYKLQQEINKRLKMRPIPKIQFIEEKQTKEAERVEELLEEIKKEKD